MLETALILVALLVLVFALVAQRIARWPLTAQLSLMKGEVKAPGKMKVGYFTQYQVEELAGD